MTVVFGHDGHGSVRVLTDMAAAVVQAFVYDAYGQLLAIMNGAGGLVSGGINGLANAAMAQTSLLYSGEQFDSRIGQQYLRARWYDAVTGRFNRLDPFFGNQQDPQSFHKYLYVHGDPVNGADPTGKYLGAAVSVSIMAGIGATFAVTANGLRNKSQGQSFWQGSKDAAWKGAVLGVVAGLFPVVGLGFALFAIMDSPSQPQ